jgi:glucose dehydrogenase
MAKRNNSVRLALLASSVLAIGSSAFAAEVTPERLTNADREPHNWLMNHRTYDGQRYSPLSGINRDNVRNLKVAYAVPLGGTTGRPTSRKKKTQRPRRKSPVRTWSTGIPSNVVLGS